MYKKRRAALTGLLVLVGLLSGSAASSFGFDYADYAHVLTTHTNDSGMVDYPGLKAERAPLDRFAASLATLDRATYETWPDAERVAFWINAYNSLTLKLIIDNYPIQSSFLASIRFPKNSIRQISGAWDKIRFEVMGTEMTLDQIEHQTLRAQFGEPRIHMALVCAAMGCPPLRNEPYVAGSLDAQLDDQTQRFLDNPPKFRVDREEGRAHLSSIFKWFGEDFVENYGSESAFAGHGESERAVLSFVSGYLEPEDQRYLRDAEYTVNYLSYDWSLNEQPNLRNTGRME